MRCGCGVRLPLWVRCVVIRRLFVVGCAMLEGRMRTTLRRRSRSTRIGRGVVMTTAVVVVVRSERAGARRNSLGRALFFMQTTVTCNQVWQGFPCEWGAQGDGSKRDVQPSEDRTKVAVELKGLIVAAVIKRATPPGAHLRFLLVLFLLSFGVLFLFSVVYFSAFKLWLYFFLDR